MKGKVKNAPLEASNVAVLLEHIPIGATRSIHSLQVKRVEADHYSIAGGPVIDLVDAMAQIGSYSGKHSNPRATAPRTEQGRWEAMQAQREGLTVTQWRAKRKAERAEMMAERKAYRAEQKVARKAYRERKAAEKAAGPKQRGTRVAGQWQLLEEAPGWTTTWTASSGTTPKSTFYFIEQVFARDLLQTQPGMRAGQFKIGAARSAFDSPHYQPQVFDTFEEAAQAIHKHDKRISTQQPNPKARKSQAELLAAAEKKLRAAAKKQVKAKHTPKARKSPDELLAAAKKKLRAAAKKSNPAAKFERGKAAGGGHREERGYFYEVLNSAGTVVALTTSKDEAQDVCNNPKQLGLPKSEYSFRHIGGKKLVPTTEAGTRARKVK